MMQLPNTWADALRSDLRAGSATPGGQETGPERRLAMLDTAAQSSQALLFCLRYDFPTEWLAGPGLRICRAVCAGCAHRDLRRVELMARCPA
jgi:hypothetical protein